MPAIAATATTMFAHLVSLTDNTISGINQYTDTHQWHNAIQYQTPNSAGV